MALAHFKALNVDSSDESESDAENPSITREALEEKAVGEYTKILLLQKNKQWEEAKEGLQKLLESEVLSRAAGSVTYVGGKLQPSLAHLKYCILTNLGQVLTELGKIKPAVDYYLEAVTLDDTDINLWYRIGKAAIKIPNLNLASYAFQEALRCNPNHWPSLDTLITVLYASGNYLLCLYYISEGLEKDNEFMKGIAFSQKIFDEHPSFIRDFPLYYPQCLLDEKLKECGKIELDDPMYVSMFKEADALKSSFETLQWPRENRDVVVNNVKPERPLRKKSWIALGQCLLQVYSRLKEEYPEVSFYRLVDLSEDDINVSSKTGNEVEEKDDILDDNLIDKEVDKINESQSENDNDTGSRSKRRRSSPSLSDQWMTFSKRRSARVRSTVRRDEPTLARTLHNLLPSSLRPSKDDYKNNVDPVRWSEDSMDTMDLYRLFESKDGGVSQESNDQHIDIVNNTSDEERNRRRISEKRKKKRRLIEKEKYFYCEKEVNDIKLFIKKNNCRDILTLLNNYVKLLATKWKLWWPSHLTTLYLKIYKIIRQHSPENCQTSDSLDLSAAQAVLLYGELLLDYWLQRGKDLGLPSPITGSVFGGDFCTLIFGDFSYLCDDSEDATFVVRCYWLEALMYLHAGSTESTMIALQRYMNDERCDNVQVKLVNIKNHYVVNNDIIERLYNTLNRNESLNGIQKLFNNKNYEKVAEILMETLQPSIKLLNAEFVEPIVDRCTQFSLLLDSLFELERYEDCFIWCELCSHEAMNQCRTSLEDSSGNKSKWLILLTNTLQGLPYCIDHGGRDVIKKLPNNRLIRLIQTMSSIVCHQIESSDSADIPFETIFPWILLYEILKHYEDTSGRVIDDEIPNSLTLLFTAHEYLGRRSWCCCDEAEILFKTLTVLLPIMESSNPDTDKMLILNQQMEQIFYCLYGHPIKRNRPRYVQEHNSMGLALTWSRSKLVYRFLKPRELPMYDSSARYSISLDVEVLFRRIVGLLPNENNPSHLVEKLNNYIEGTSNELPNNKNLLPEEIVDIYYLIADHYFKNKAWSKALKYYILDVCANPNRVDSWACLALARGSQLETKLNSCEPIKNEQDFLKRAKMSCRCYQRSLQLDPEQSTLWIEYGSFSYMVHSFCSRLLNQEQNLSLELFDILESQKNEMLQTASKCFTSANMLWTSYEKLGVEPEIQDERWLHHYMLGKIAEKKEEKPSVYLGHFMKSTKFLHLNNAKYPEHVSYSNPQLYSVEALELYYRIHACILKLVEQSEEQPLSDELSRLFFEILERSACGPFANFGKFIEYGSGNECDDFGNIDDISKGTPLIEIEANYVLNNILETISTDENENNPVTNKRKLSDVTSDNEVEENAEESDCKKFKSTDEPDTDEKELVADCESKVLQRQKSKESDSGNDLKNENSDDPSVKTENKSEDNKKVLKKEKSQDSSSETLSDTDTTSSDTDSSDDSSSSEDSNSSSSDSSQQNSSDEDKPPPSKKMKMSKPLRDWKEEQRCLIDRCLSAMEECVRRFPEHYKSIYRQAHYYFRSKVRSDNNKVRQLLLGEGGLFADRKPNHFFNGVWRIPSSEIDRPGSFAGHMSRCLHLLLDLLRDSRDHKMLLTLSLQLKDTPEPDKKYVRDEEREQIAKESVTLSAQAFRRKLHETHKSSEIQNVLNESYKYYKRINKFWPLRDSPFISLVTQCFVKYLKSKGETKYKSTFEAACRFCMDGTLIPLPPKIKTPPPPPPPALLPPPPPPPPVLQPEPVVASKQPSQISFPVPPTQVMHPITVTTTSSCVAPSVLTGTTTNILPPTTINNPIVKGNNNQSNTKLGAPLKRPRGRPAGGSVRHPNPLSQMSKKEPNIPKDLQMLYKNLPYSHQQLMNMMRNPMFAMQAASVQQQFNQQVSVQQELMRQLAINQQSAQKPPSSATIAASSMTPTPTSLLNKNILPTTNTNLSSLGTMPKDHPNITITAVSPTATKSSSSVTQTQRSSNIKTSSAHSSILKSNVGKPQLTATSKSIKRDVPSPLNISPPTSKSPVICSPNSLLKTNQSPILSPYNHPLPPQIPPLLSSQIRNSMSTLPIIASSPSTSGGSDMSLQHKLSAKRNKQSPPLLNPQMKEPITTDPSLFRYDHTIKDKSLTSPHHSFNKNLMDISKNNPNLNEANKYNISRSTTISKIQSKNMSDQKQLQKDLGLSISTVHNSELSSKLSSLSPKEITLTRLPQQNLTADINPNPGNSNIHQDPLKNKSKQINVHHQIRQDLSQIQHQQLPAAQYHHNMPPNIPSDYRKPPPVTTSSIVDNRISALKAIGTQLTITPSLSNSNNPELMKKQDVNKYPDRPEVTIAPAAAAAAAATSKDKQKKDACELILL